MTVADSIAFNMKESTMINKHHDKLAYIHNAQTAAAEAEQETTSSRQLTGPSGQTLEVGEVVRTQFENGDLVLVHWENDRTLIHAPWDELFPRYHLTGDNGMSSGFLVNDPHNEAVVIFPHMAMIPFDVDGDKELGEIVIPYGSVLAIAKLISKKELSSETNEEVA
jgi:hypothetical protein